MTPDTMHWLLGMIGASTVTIIGAVVSLLVVAYRIGRIHHGIQSEREARERLTRALERVDERLATVDRLATKVEQLEASHAEERRRFSSDWPEMVSKVSALWAKVFSLQEWRKSNHDIAGE